MVRVEKMGIGEWWYSLGTSEMWKIVKGNE